MLTIGLLLAAVGPGAAAPLRARYLRIESGASNNYLHFAELEVYVGGKNVAVGKPVSASSTMQPFTPDKAVDGIVGYVWGVNPSFWSSAGGKGGEWWEVDLGRDVAIERLVLYNRLDVAQERLEGAVLLALSGDRKTVFQRTLSGVSNPTEVEFVPQEVKPVNLDAKTLVERRADLGPRFTAPSEDTGYVMPVGSGDFSAMLRYGSAYEIHLSKTDFFGPDSILSPGHIQLSFGVAPEAVTKFEQRLDLNRGSVVLTLGTAEGTVTAETYGVMGRNALVVAVEHTRPVPQVQATFSSWRPATALTTDGGVLRAREVHDFDESGKRVAAGTKANPDDRFYNLGVGTAVAFAGASGRLAASGVNAGDGADKTATMRATPGRRYWLIITCATGYDGKPEVAAGASLEALAGSDKSQLRAAQVAWWNRFWQESALDLYGRDAERLTRLWHTSLYSYASVGEGAVLPKFNGGPGLVHQDDRCWGWGYWWQNTRELIWPMFAANHLRYARAHLDFYDRTFMDYKRQTASNGKAGIRVWEGASPFKPGSLPPPKSVSSFDPTALATAMADRRMESVGSGYNARSMAQGAELVQLMFDRVAFTGESEYLKTVIAPWLKEVALFYLSYLKLDDDGLYHTTPSDALEMWWQVKDPMTDMCAVRYCFWQALNHGAEFGYEPALLATIRDRLGKLAPLPTGRWKRRAAAKEEVPPGRPSYISQMVGEVEQTDEQYAPAAAFLADRMVYNAEQPELYVIYPFALADARSPAAGYERAVKTFRARQNANTYGWSQDGIQAARLRLPETVDVIMDHVGRHQLYPYGGWVNAAVPLKGSKLDLSDVPYFDTAGVNMTALQEALLQSHALTTPERTDPLGGGPIVILPAVRSDWAGRFRLRARGGFLVSVEFQAKRTPTRIRIESERGQMLRLENPFVECRVTRGGKQVFVSREAVLAVPTKSGDVLEFTGQVRRPAAH